MSAIFLEMQLTMSLFRLCYITCINICLYLSLGTFQVIAQEDARTGEIVVLVFDLNGLPVEHVRVRVGNIVVGETDEEGVATIQVPAGQITLSLEKDGLPSERTPSFPVEAGRSLEIIATYTKSSRSVLDIETAVGKGTLANDTAELGNIEGIISNDRGLPVIDAQIFVRGSPIKARTSVEGQFVLHDVPATTVDITVIHPDYSTKTITSIVVPPNETKSISVSVIPAASASQTFVVSIPKLTGGTVFVLEERRESSSVADLLGADQIAKSGDSDAAAALQRVTGITLVDGRYVYVRGLGERYTTTLLDNSSLPSPDPERRVVPLDIFPAAIIGSLVVQKTFSPDLPGEFGGGTVNIRTRAPPKDFVFSISASTSHLDRTTFTNSVSQDGTSTDWLGFGTNERSPNGTFQAALDRGNIDAEFFSREERQALAIDLNNDFSVTSRDIPPNVGLGLTLGGTVPLGRQSIGMLVGLTYGNNWFSEKSVVNQFRLQGGALRPLLGYGRLSTLNTISLGGLALINYELAKDHNIATTIAINRISESNSFLQYGTDNTLGQVTRVTRIQWIEQQLLTAQLRGEHQDISPAQLRLEWRYMFSYATRDEPDRREITYQTRSNPLDDRDTGTVRNAIYIANTQDQQNQRFYSALEELNHDLSLDITLPIQLFGKTETKFKSGFSLLLKDRNVDTRRLRYLYQDRGSQDNVPDVDLTTLPDQIFNPDTLLNPDGPAGFGLTEITLDNDSYDANQVLVGGYLMGDLGFTENLHLLLGARVESFQVELSTFRPGETTPNESADLSMFNVMPAATLTWEFVENMQLRLAASQTVSRPIFRELSPAISQDLSGNIEFSGNTDIKGTTITNLDLRYEWYPSPGESFSLSGFYKYFSDPIEQQVLTGATTRYIPNNIPEAFNIGGEIESRIEFGFLHSVLADLYFAGNFTAVFSEVSLPDEFIFVPGETGGVLTSKTRALALQSPWVINAQLGYDNPGSGLSLSVLYNLFGPRIWAVGQFGQPDIYEQPFDRLNFVASWAFGRFALKFKATNLLDPLQRVTQFDEVDNIERIVRSYYRGRQVSLGLNVDLN